MNDSKKTILIVEDSIVQALAVQLLLEQCGLNVLRATSGEQGLSLARDSQPDLILLDIQLPGIDGFQFCRLLRDDVSTLNIPIILFTVHGDQEMFRKGFAGGTIDFIPKDAFYTSVLLETLKQMGIIKNNFGRMNYQSN
jgi:CheY-like chemotaxis protein